MNLLTSRQEIMDHLKLTKTWFSTFVRLGMPVTYINGRCFAHKENLDEYFKQITRVSMKNVPDEILNAEDSLE